MSNYIFFHLYVVFFVVYYSNKTGINIYKASHDMDRLVLFVIACFECDSCSCRTYWG